MGPMRYSRYMSIDVICSGTCKLIIQGRISSEGHIALSLVQIKKGLLFEWNRDEASKVRPRFFIRFLYFLRGSQRFIDKTNCIRYRDLVLDLQLIWNFKWKDIELSPEDLFIADSFLRSCVRIINFCGISTQGYIECLHLNWAHILYLWTNIRP